MSGERWRRIEELYHAARAHDASERAAFLMAACAGDEALRREVESLLAQPASAEGFLDGPAVAGAAQVPGGRGGSDLTGRRIGIYQVQALIGSGGMGQVYRARDTRLGREVAIKILPPIVTSDPERLARFEREARVLASLNHPNIATIYGIEDFDGVPALVLELMTGETLAERIARGPLSPPEMLTVARQIVDGLGAAHERGILHRDLKPANLYLIGEGRAKILDFGIAKHLEPDETAPTHDLRTLATAPGTFLGTPAYASPEQIAGDSVDQRSDLFALGLVLYEMATGRLPHPGTSLAHMLAGSDSVRIDPPSRLQPGLPSGFDAVVLRLLRKEPRERFQSAAELSAALSKLGQSSRLPLYAGVGILALLAAIAIALRAGVGRGKSSHAAEYIRLTNFPDAVHSPALSRDGKTLLFVRGSEPF